MNLYESVKTKLTEADAATIYDKAISSTKSNEIEAAITELEKQLDYEERRNAVTATSSADLAYVEEIKGYIDDLKNRLDNLDECDKSVKESEEPEEDKSLPFEERVLRAYDNCHYSLRADMPTITDIVKYLGISDDTDTRDKVSQVIYKAGKDWQIEECDKSKDKKPLKESYDMYNVVEELMDSVENLKKSIDDGTFNDLRTVSKELELILKNAKENISEAW